MGMGFGWCNDSMCPAVLDFRLAYFRDCEMIKIENITRPSKEIYVEGDGVTVTVNTWSNCEGVNLMLNGAGPDLPLRMAGALRWSDIDAILIALTAARSA